MKTNFNSSLMQDLGYLGVLLQPGTETTGAGAMLSPEMITPVQSVQPISDQVETLVEPQPTPVLTQLPVGTDQQPTLVPQVCVNCQSQVAQPQSSSVPVSTSIMDWVKSNPWLAFAIGAGVAYLLTHKSKN